MRCVISLNSLTGKRVHISISEIKQPDLTAQLVADNIALSWNVVSLSVAHETSYSAYACGPGRKVFVFRFLVVWVERKSLVQKVTLKVPFHFILFARTSTMRRLKRIRPMAGLA